MSTEGGRDNRGRWGLLSKLLLAAALFLAGLALMAVTAFHILPLGVVENRVKASFRAQGAVVSWQSLGRTFPFGLKATGVEVIDISTAMPVVRLEEARARLDIFALFSGSLSFPINARMDGGVITGRAVAGPRTASLDMQATGIRIDAIPAVAAAGVVTRGVLEGTLSVIMPYSGCPTGSVRLRSGPIDGRDVKFGGLPLPLGTIDQAGLNAALGNCRAVIEGLWVDGSEFSAKLAGVMALAPRPVDSRLDMTLDITARGNLARQGWLNSFLGPYRKGSNYYHMSIRGTLARPVTGR